MGYQQCLPSVFVRYGLYVIVNRVLTEKEQPQREIHMYCSSCGTKLNDDAKFCTNCGTQVSGITGKSPIQKDGQIQAEEKKTNAIKGVLGVIGGIAGVLFAIFMGMILFGC